MIRTAIVCFVLLICLAHTAPSSGAEISPPETGLEFEIGQDFTLKSFDAMSIAWKRRSSEHRGWRLGLDLSGRILNRDDRNAYSSSSRTSSGDDDSYGARLELQKLFYRTPRRDVAGYWGLGPSLSYGERNDTQINVLDDDSYEYKNMSHYWTAGLGLSMGVEWRVLDQLSVGAEYSAYLNYRHWEYTQTRTEDSETYFSKRTEDGFIFGDVGAAMNVTVFF